MNTLSDCRLAITRTYRLGDLLDFRNDMVHPHDKPVGSATFVGLEHIEQNTGVRLGAVDVELSELTGRRARFRAGDIVYGYLRPYLNKVWIAEFNGLCSVDQYVFAVRPGVDRNYIARFLRSNEFLRLAPVNQSPGQLPRIRSGEIADTPVRFPPLDEQRRIAAILDKADALRRKRKRAIKVVESLTQSMFIEIFGDPVINPKGFRSLCFGEVGSLDRGVSKHRPRNDPKLLGGQHPLIQTGDVANSGGYIRSFTSTYSDEGLHQSKKWPAGTLCITIAANIAQTGILTFPACFPDSVVGFTHEQPAMAEFVRVWLMFLQSTLEKTAPAVAQKNINLQILRDLRMALRQ